MIPLRPVPRRVARAASLLVLLAWTATMGVLVRKAWSSSPAALATDLAGYAGSAQWRGIYYRGDKIGFSVGQTTPVPGGFEMREDGRLQMTLLGATTAVRMSGRARVDEAFRLRTFSFSLDPGTGPTEVRGSLENGTRLVLTVRTPSGERSETRDLPEPPALALNLPRLLAARGLRPGTETTVAVFDPLTMRNTPMTLRVGPREVVRAAGRPVPAFVVESRFSGITTRSWITDVGETVREESPMGLLTLRETCRSRPRPSRCPARCRPTCSRPRPSLRRGCSASTISTTVERLRLRLGPRGTDAADLDGDGQTRTADVLEVRDLRDLTPAPAPADSTAT
ncbi:MAG: hypothetical protein U0599_12625 [Vicinamibacteria bacterium]